MSLSIITSSKEYLIIFPLVHLPLRLDIMVSSTLKSVGLFAIGAAAHGAVTSYKIAGQDYPG